MARFITLFVSAVLLLANPAHAEKPQPSISPAVMLFSGIARLNQHSDYLSFKEDLTNLKQQLFSENSAALANNLCPALENLPASDLFLFYDELATQLASSLYCQKALHKKVVKYLREERQRLQRKLPKIVSDTLTQCQTRKDQRNTLGPEEIHIVPLDIGTPLTGANFADCKINFTFDDGPHGELTPNLLETLAAENVRVNFFDVGQNVRRWPKIVQATAAAGHLVGNHSNTHANLRKLSYRDGAEEIRLGHQALFDVLGFYLPFFRFPYGAYTQDLRKLLYKEQQVEFFWNFDTLDWKIREPEALLTYALQQVEKSRKGIVLFHDVQPQTILIMPLFLKALNVANYDAVQIRPAE